MKLKWQGYNDTAGKKYRKVTVPSMNQQVKDENTIDLFVQSE